MHNDLQSIRERHALGLHTPCRYSSGNSICALPLGHTDEWGMASAHRLIERPARTTRESEV